MRVLLLFVMAPVLAFASTAPTLHVWDNGPPRLPPSTATASFDVPKGWSGIMNDAKWHGSERYWLCPTEQVGVHGHPGIELLFAYLDSTAPYTEVGQAEAYLKATRHHVDDKVQMRRVGAVHHPDFGPINLFHFYSDYWGERLYAVLLAAPVGVTIELTCRRASDLRKYRPVFEELLRSIHLHGTSKTA